MKADDILKQLGFSDEELKSFFNKQKKYSEKVNKIKDYKDSFGITMHTPAYTPRTLVNRLSSMYVPEGRTSTDAELLKAGHKVSELARDFDLFGKIEREQETELQSYEEGIPNEIYSLAKNFLELVNNFVSVDTSEQAAENLVNKYKDDLHFLLIEIDRLTEILLRYIQSDVEAEFDEETGQFIGFRYTLQIALTDALALIKS